MNKCRPYEKTDVHDSARHDSLRVTHPERLDSLLDLPGGSITPPELARNPTGNEGLLANLIRRGWDLRHFCDAGDL